MHTYAEWFTRLQTYLAKCISLSFSLAGYAANPYVSLFLLGSYSFALAPLMRAHLMREQDASALSHPPTPLKARNANARATH